MQPQSLYILQCLLLFDSIVILFAEYFTSSIHLNELLQKELYLRDQTQDYIKQRELRLEILKKFYTTTRDTTQYINADNATLYGGHPLYVYSCILRMSRDWQQVKESANKKHNLQYSISEMKYQNLFPSQDDIRGAKSALIRLQETFALPTREIMYGLQNQPGYTPKLDVVDAYRIGFTAFQQKRHHQSISWMKEVLHILNRNNTTEFYKFNVTKARFQAYDVLSWAEYHVNNLLAAYKYTLELLKIDPNVERIHENLELIEGHMKEENITVTEETIDQINVEPEEAFTSRILEKPYRPFYYLPEEEEMTRYDVERERANSLCRGETDPIPRKYRKYLYCWFKSDHPLLVLKPAKVERLYPRPEIVMFRDAITDSEMRRIKELANPLLRRATVNNPQTGKLEFANYRVSKSAWLNRNDDEDLVDTMNNRIDAMTGLDMKHAEELQVANYGIGGYYEPHFDFARIVPVRPPPWRKRDNYTRQRVTRLHSKNTDAGERVATILFYMSNVKRGGATVFTNIGQAVTPSKGDAVFWYNLMHDGSGDYETRHAACPVLIGEKWVCNRWLHEFGQEFRRPCKLRHDDDWM